MPSHLHPRARAHAVLPSPPKIATPVELADETPLISLMEIDPSVTLIVGRTKTPKPLGKYTFLIKVVESVLVRSPGNEVFMTPG